MIVSHKHRFIFIKTKKTAGTSIEAYLSPLCGSEDILTPVWPHVEPHRARNHRGLWNPLPELMHKRGRRIGNTLAALRRRERFYNHIPARLARLRLSPAVWNRCFKFCVDRNPWDKTVSHYHNTLARGAADLTWEQYLERGHFCHNDHFYTNEQGALIVDRVLRYESLNEQLAEVFAQLGVPWNGSLGVNAKGDYRTDRRPYREWYSGEQRALIERAFAREIALHGYTF